MQSHILFVDDDYQISAMTKEYLEAKDLKVTLVHNAEAGIDIFKRQSFDLCLFDVKMPIIDGFTLAQQIRALDELIPIIFLTGKSELKDRIEGLALGADDYITKPFSMQELTLRINAILKRVNSNDKTSNPIISIGSYTFNPSSRELFYQGKSTKLSAIEARLLRLLTEHLNALVKRDFALQRIWQDDDYLKGRSLNVYISKLRKYLGQDKRIEILNVHGEGYRLVVK